MSLAPNANNILLGRGAVYFDRFNASGVKQGKYHLGNVETFEITNTPDVREKFSSMDKDSGLLKQVTVRLDVDIKLTGSELNADNMALALFGTSSLFAQNGATLVDETISPAGGTVQGRYYQTAEREISAVTVDDDAILVVDDGTNYVITDATVGIIKVVVGGSIADGSVLTASYTSAAIANRPQVAGANVAQIEGELTFVGDPAAGQAVEVVFWMASVTPDGPVALLGDDFGVWALNFKALDDKANHPNEPFYRYLEI